VILLVINCSSTGFGRLYAHHQEVRLRFTAYGLFIYDMGAILATPSYDSEMVCGIQILEKYTDFYSGNIFVFSEITTWRLYGFFPSISV
jgi:hypothetical protein